MSLIIGSSSISDLGKIQNLSPENNIRLEKQKEKEILNNILTEHTKDRDNFNKIKLPTIDINIKRLKDSLSKKYTLEDNEYLVLIDKFHVHTRGITKTVLSEIILYLNSFKTTSIQQKPNIVFLEKPKVDLTKLESERNTQLDNIRINKKDKPIVKELPINLEIIDNNMNSDMSHYFDALPKTNNYIELVINLINYNVNNDGFYDIPIWCNNSDFVNKSASIIIESCHINEELFNNNGKLEPLTYIKINEVNDQVYINGVVKGFSNTFQFKPIGKYYRYKNKHMRPLICCSEIKKLTIGLFQSNGDQLKLKSDKTDEFHIVLHIY